MTALWRLSNSQDLMPRARPAGRWHAAGAAVVVLDATPAAAVFAPGAGRGGASTRSAA